MEIVLTKDGSFTARHPECDQEFHSLEGARFEAEHLYIKGSGIAFDTEQLTVLDVGMGLGYNALTTIEAWASCAGAIDLNLISLEKDPVLVEHLNSQTGPWQSNWSEQWKSFLNISIENGMRVVPHPNGRSFLRWKIFAVEASSDFHWAADQKFNFIWQDPFSLPHNPELWSAEWFSKLKQHAAANATLMTYSVARGVKDALTHSGWNWSLIATPGVKRHWMRAQ